MACASDNSPSVQLVAIQINLQINKQLFFFFFLDLGHFLILNESQLHDSDMAADCSVVHNARLSAGYCGLDPVLPSSVFIFHSLRLDLRELELLWQPAYTKLHS